MTLSSCEAEYIAAIAAACQGMWLNRLISELRGEKEGAVKLLVNNKSAIILSKNPVHHSHTKHIDTHYHFICQCAEEKKIVVDFLKMEDQVTNIHTKSLRRQRFVEIR